MGGYANGNYEPFIGTFTGIYNSMLGADTPYEILINGLKDGLTVNYDITVSMDDDLDSDNKKVQIIVVEDNIMSYWGSVGIDHNARNVARYWISTEDLDISSSDDYQTFSGSFVIDDEAWNPDSIKIISMVQDYNTYAIHQVQELNVNQFDTDQDGIMNSEDNCMTDYNPGQEDIDGDGIGDECDPCDNENIFVLGNVNGDLWYYDDVSLEPSVSVDLFDVLRLVEIVESNDTESCGYQAADFTGEGDVNTFDIYALVGLIMDGTV